MRAIKDMIRLFRINEWFSDVFLWYLSILVLSILLSGSSFKAASLFVFYHFIMLCYGYVVNSYADIRQDIIAGKRNVFAGYSKDARDSIILTSSFIVFLMPIVLFRGFSLVIAIAYINLAIAAYYSLEPIRLKEKGFISIVAASLSQGSLSYLMFSLYSGIGYEAYLGFFLWIFFIEASDDITHQICDYINDKRAKVSTFTTKRGLRNASYANYILISSAALLPSIYFFQDIYKGGMSMLLLGAFTWEKYSSFKEEKYKLFREIIKCRR